MNFQFDEPETKNQPRNKTSQNDEKANFYAKQQMRYPHKSDLLGLESLDSLGVFMRQNALSNSEFYPFYNNYNANNIADYQGFAYRSILCGNKYNSTNIGTANSSYKKETHEEFLDRQMRQIAKSKVPQKISPNQLRLTSTQIGNNQPPMLALAEYFQDAENKEEEQGFTEQDEEDRAERDFLSELVEPFKEEDFELQKINNKFFDNHLNFYSEQFRPRTIDNPELFKQRQEYFQDKLSNDRRRPNKDQFIFYIFTERGRNTNNNPKSQEKISEKELPRQLITKGNLIFKMDLERKLFRQERVELNGLDRFSQLQIKGTDQLFVCGGKSNGIAQNVCMIVDFSLTTFLIRSQLEQARTDHLLLQLDEFIYIIGGQGINGETLLSCERYSIKNQTIRADAPLQLPRNHLSGVVSQLNHCLYVAGTPLIIDGAVELQKYEPHTNFWEIIKIDVSFLLLKQPRYIRLALHDESIHKSQLYIFCLQLKQFENFTLSLHDLTSQTVSSANFTLSTVKQTPQQLLAQSAAILKNNPQMQFTKHASQPNLNIQQLAIDDPRRDPFYFVPGFNDQCKLNYSSKKKYEESLLKRMHLLSTLEALTDHVMAQQPVVMPGTSIRVRSNSKQTLVPSNISAAQSGLIFTQDTYSTNASTGVLLSSSLPARVESEKSDFNEMDILASRDFEVFTVNKANPVEIELFDYLSWKKTKIFLQFFPDL